MDDAKLSIGECLFEAMEEFAGKINTIITRDPDDTGELACLYSGISGIEACTRMLETNGYITSSDTEKLRDEIKRLYGLCAPVRR